MAFLGSFQWLGQIYHLKNKINVFIYKGDAEHYDPCQTCG